MEFPADYDTKMFPETRYLSMARAFAIWSGVLFLLIIGFAGVLVWTMRVSQAEPVLVSISNDGKNWTAVLNNDNRTEYSVAHIMQESVVGNFAKSWFKISRDMAENEKNWCRCERKDCESNDANVSPCFLCCASGENLYSNFSEVLNADFRARAVAGEEWSVVNDSIRAMPIGEINDNGGLWRLTATVNMNGTMQRIEAFVRTAKSADNYTKTLGYYVSGFNAYPGE